MKTTAYLRMSTDKQDEASQRQIIEDWLRKNESIGIEWIADTASGSTPWQARQLNNVINSSKEGDQIIISEISRIARSTIGVLSFLQEAASRKITVIAIKSGIQLDGSTASKIVVTVLAMAAEIERDLLRERTKAALQARKGNGLAIGRQQGAKGKLNKLHNSKQEIETLLAAKVSKSAIARILKVSRQTLHTHLLKQNQTERKDQLCVAI